MKSFYPDICRRLSEYYLIQTVPGEFLPSPAYDALLDRKAAGQGFGEWRQLVTEAATRGPADTRIALEQDPFIPSYQAVLGVATHDLGRVVYQQSLVVYLSLLGPYYTLYGLEEVMVVDEEGNDAYSCEPVLCPSPTGAYRAWFPVFRAALGHRYPDHAFVPYHTLVRPVKRLATATNVDEPDDCVFQGLFALEDIRQYKTSGDCFYE